MSIELKIKQVSLALEAQYIKQQEQKLREYADNCFEIASQCNDPICNERYNLYAQKHNWKRHSLEDHRKGIVADEARSTNIARAYIKGKPYSYAESEAYKETNPPNIKRIAEISYKYTTGRGYQSPKGDLLKAQMELIEEWIKQHPKFK